MKERFQGSIRTVALIGKYRSPEIRESLLALSAHMESRGIAVLLEAGTAEAVGVQGTKTVAYGDIGSVADVAVVMGGDGTMLNAARQLACQQVPMVGVNQGRLGFMTDLSQQDVNAGIDDLLAGKFFVERRLLLEAQIIRDGQTLLSTPALNDVVFNKGDVGRMIELELRVDGEFLYVLRADGLIVATPTGSTAYALSANGPILHPSVHGMAIVPLCPHALTNRPISIPDSSVVEISLLDTYDGRVHFDGQGRFDAHAGDTVRVARSSHQAILLHPPGYSYFAMLRQKLHWSATPKH